MAVIDGAGELSLRGAGPTLPADVAAEQGAVYGDSLVPRFLWTMTSKRGTFHTLLYESLLYSDDIWENAGYSGTIEAYSFIAHSVEFDTPVKSCFALACTFPSVVVSNLDISLDKKTHAIAPVVAELLLEHTRITGALQSIGHQPNAAPVTISCVQHALPAHTSRTETALITQTVGKFAGPGFGYTHLGVQLDSIVFEGNVGRVPYPANGTHAVFYGNVSLNSPLYGYTAEYAGKDVIYSGRYASWMYTPVCGILHEIVFYPAKLVVGSLSARVADVEDMGVTRGHPAPARTTSVSVSDTPAQYAAFLYTDELYRGRKFFGTGGSAALLTSAFGLLYDHFPTYLCGVELYPVSGIAASVPVGWVQESHEVLALTAEPDVIGGAAPLVAHISSIQCSTDFRKYPVLAVSLAAEIPALQLGEAVNAFLAGINAVFGYPIVVTGSGTAARQLPTYGVELANHPITDGVFSLEFMATLRAALVDENSLFTPVPPGTLADSGAYELLFVTPRVSADTPVTLRAQVEDTIICVAGSAFPSSAHNFINVVEALAAFGNSVTPAVIVPAALVESGYAIVAYSAQPPRYFHQLAHILEPCLFPATPLNGLAVEYHALSTGYVEAVRGDMLAPAEVLKYSCSSIGDYPALLAEFEYIGQRYEVEGVVNDWITQTYGNVLFGYPSKNLAVDILSVAEFGASTLSSPQVYEAVGVVSDWLEATSSGVLPIYESGGGEEISLLSGELLLENVDYGILGDIQIFEASAAIYNPLNRWFFDREMHPPERITIKSYKQGNAQSSVFYGKDTMYCDEGIMYRDRRSGRWVAARLDAYDVWEDIKYAVHTCTSSVCVHTFVLLDQMPFVEDLRLKDARKFLSERVYPFRSGIYLTDTYQSFGYKGAIPDAVTLYHAPYADIIMSSLSSIGAIPLSALAADALTCTTDLARAPLWLGCAVDVGGLYPLIDARVTFDTQTQFSALTEDVGATFWACLPPLPEAAAHEVFYRLAQPSLEPAVTVPSTVVLDIAHTVAQFTIARELADAACVIEILPAHLSLAGIVVSFAGTALEVDNTYEATGYLHSRGALFEITGAVVGDTTCSLGVASFSAFTVAIDTVVSAPTVPVRPQVTVAVLGAETASMLAGLATGCAFDSAIMDVSSVATYVSRARNLTAELLMSVGTVSCGAGVETPATFVAIDVTAGGVSRILTNTAACEISPVLMSTPDCGVSLFTLNAITQFADFVFDPHTAVLSSHAYVVEQTTALWSVGEVSAQTYPSVAVDALDFSVGNAARRITEVVESIVFLMSVQAPTLPSGELRDTVVIDALGTTIPQFRAAMHSVVHLVEPIAVMFPCSTYIGCPHPAIAINEVWVAVDDWHPPVPCRVELDIELDYHFTEPHEIAFVF